MYLCIHGFLAGDVEDDSLKYRLEIAETFNEPIMKLLDQPSLRAMSEGEWLLSGTEAAGIATIIGKALPEHLDLFIGVEA
jgi:hypothetical protein